MLENFIRLNTWTDPVARTGFIEDMTVFYWAWWIAYGPFMGLFVTRISRGRTVRQLILGMLVLGTLGCALFYAVLGNYSMHLDLSGALPVRDIAAQAGTETAIAQSIGFLPLGPLVLAVFALVAIVFIATTYDSASYCLAASATRNLPEGTHPARWHRLFWACARRHSAGHADVHRPGGRQRPVAGDPVGHPGRLATPPRRRSVDGGVADALAS